MEFYQLSNELVKNIYKLSSSFPPDEKYALVQQINKSPVSVASNIAEGTSILNSILGPVKIFNHKNKGSSDYLNHWYLFFDEYFCLI